MRKTPYYQEILNHFFHQFYTGKLREGDTLDSMESLQVRFAASPNTIRTVIRRLSQEGYLDTGSGKPTTVVSIIGDRQKAYSRICARKREIAESFDFLRMLLPSLAVFSARHFREEIFAELFEVLDALNRDYADGSAFRQSRCRLIQGLLSGLPNPLVLESVGRAETNIMSTRMVFDAIGIEKDIMHSDRQTFARQMRLAVMAAREKDYERMNRLIFEIYTENKQHLLSAIGSAETLEETLPEPQTGYLYDVIVSEIICRLYEGVYGPGDMLPSIGEMCERYQVSIPTVKKAYHLLSDLGLTRTMNGKGTMVILFTETEETEPSLERMTNLSAFLESVELVMTTVRDVAIYTADRLPPAEIDAIEERLRLLWAQKEGRQMHSIPVLLFEVIHATRCRPLELLYQEVRKRLVWSIYLDRFLPDVPKELEYRHYLCLSALTEWRRGDAAQFGTILEAALSRCIGQYRECFQRQIQLLSA